MTMMPIRYTVCAALLCSASTLLASSFSSASLKNIDLSISVGPSWTHSDNTRSVISTYETDSILVSHVTKSALWRAGVGYHFFASKLERRRFLNDLFVQLNLYHSEQTIRGNIWQYQYSQFNNYRFAVPLDSLRLMLDVKPSLFTYYHLSLYPIAGLGVAWNKLSYRENVQSGSGVTSDSRLFLGVNTDSQFAYDFGAGLRADLTDHLSASLEYLYTNLGDATPSMPAKNGVLLSSPPTFNLSTQAVLFGFAWKI